MFKKTLRFLSIALLSAALVSCGGSGGGATGNNGGGATQPASLVITITPVDSSVPTNRNDYPIILGSPFLTQVNVNVRFDNGTPIPDETPINFTTSNANSAPISTLDDPETTDVNEFTTLFGQVFNESSGGNGTFFVHGGQNAGTVTLTASATNPNTGRTTAQSITYQITEGPGPFDRLTITPVATTIAPNIFGLTPREAFGTIYMTEAEITFRDPLGVLSNPLNDSVGVSINPVSIAAFSTLDDPETEEDGDPLTEDNEIFILLGNGPVDMVGGRGTVFIWSDTVFGDASLSAAGVDPLTGFNIDAEVTITVGNGGNVGQIPDSVAVLGNGPLYINGSGGNQAITGQAVLTDQGQPILDSPGFNNVNLQMFTDGNASGEFIAGVNANGQNVQGTNINLTTGNGVASFQVSSGSQPNTITVIATADRADNNVDNGLQDPITAQDSYVVSDGVLFALDITNPDLSAILVNRVDGSVVIGDGDIINLDGTYSFVLSAIGTDKGGNPALPQVVQFGLVDSPVINYPSMGAGTFVISGSDGDPSEGGTSFFAPTGEFLTAADGAQPGDTLLVFGEESLGNEDLESSVTVQNVLSETSLTIVERFNRNDLTGTINNDGPVLPYIIGRAVDGNIDAVATIDENGVATTTINYPVSKLGKIAAVYAKGQGEFNNGTFRSVTDVELFAYPGLASLGDLNARLVVSPNIIPANVDTQVVVCAYDGANTPLQGLSINWNYIGDVGNGIIDGQQGAGIMANTTGPDGCAVGAISTQGIINPGGTVGFNFNAGTLTCESESGDFCLTVAEPGEAVLNANPSGFVGSGTYTITLTLTGANGQPIPGVALGGQCEQPSLGTLSIVSGPGVTDEDGQTTVTVFANINGVTEFGEGSCDFFAPGGDPSVTVFFRGVDLCLVNTSPILPAGCPMP